MRATNSTRVAQKATGNDGYEAVIGFGFMGLGGGIIVGRAIPRKMAQGMRRLLDAGYSIQVTAVDEAAYRAALPGIMAKLGFVA